MSSNRLEFCYLSDSGGANRDYVSHDEQYIRVDVLTDDVVLEDVPGKRLFVKWATETDIYAPPSDVKDKAPDNWQAEGYVKYCKYKTIRDDQWKRQYCWYAVKHGHTDFFHEWAPGEDVYDGMPYESVGYFTIQGVAANDHLDDIRPTMVQSRGDAVVNAEWIYDKANSNPSLTQYQMAERNVRFNPTHEMQKAMQYMDFNNPRQQAVPYVRAVCSGQAKG
jgi:hypothetical protein